MIFDKGALIKNSFVLAFGQFCTIWSLPKCLSGFVTRYFDIYRMNPFKMYSIRTLILKSTPFLVGQCKTKSNLKLVL